jgi:hypothetical protein
MGIFDRIFRRQSRDDDTEKICKSVDLFMRASLMLLDMEELKNDSTKQTKIMMYQFGAIDCLCQSKKLDEKRMLRVAVVSFMGDSQMTADEAIAATKLAASLSSEPDGAGWMAEGGRSILAWLKGDTNAPLRLLSLVK